MRVQNVSFTQSFVCAKNSKVNSNKLSIQPAAQTALGWFAFGVGLDFGGRKCSVFKSPAKNSLFINSVLAFMTGSYTFFKARK